MKTVKGLNLKLASKGKTTPLANFRVDPKDPNTKQCQSWNDYVLYQIKGTSQSGKTYATYEVVKVMRKRDGNKLHVYVLDRLYRTTDVVAACKYMNKLRRYVRPTEVQKDICRNHKDQYETRWLKKKNGEPVYDKNGNRVGFVALKYPASVQKIVNDRKNGNGGKGGYRRGYRKGSKQQSNSSTPF